MYVIKVILQNILKKQTSGTYALNFCESSTFGGSIRSYFMATALIPEHVNHFSKQIQCQAFV